MDNKTEVNVKFESGIDNLERERFNRFVDENKHYLKELDKLHDWWIVEYKEICNTYFGKHGIDKVVFGARLNNLVNDINNNRLPINKRHWAVVYRVNTEYTKQLAKLSAECKEMLNVI